MNRLNCRSARWAASATECNSSLPPLKKLLHGLLGLRLRLFDAPDHSFQHGLKRARAAGRAGRIHRRRSAAG